MDYIGTHTDDVSTVNDKPCGPQVSARRRNDVVPASARCILGDVAAQGELEMAGDRAGDREEVEGRGREALNKRSWVTVLVVRITYMSLEPS